MSLFNPLLVVGVGTLVGATSVIAVNVIRSRRRERLRVRREQLVAFARRSGLDYVGERPRAEDLEAAKWFRGTTDDAHADSFLQGQDRNGRFWLARRRVAAEHQEVFGFQIRGDLKVGDVWIEPAMTGEAGGTSWAQRILPRSTTPVSTTVSHWTVQRRANGIEILDENARHSVDNWVTRLVDRGRNDGRIPVGLEVHDGQGWVFSTRPLEGARVKDFLELALDLRGAVLQEVQRRPATISAPVNTVSGASEARDRAGTQPLFAVEVADGADLGEESKTVLLSAEDLLRDAPAPSKKKIRKFEIPEPEEDVEVIWAR